MSNGAARHPRRPRLVDVARARGRLDGHGLARAARPARPQRGDRGCRARGRRATSATAPTARASLLARRRTHLLGVLLDVTQPVPRRAACEALDDARRTTRGSTSCVGTTHARARRAPGGRDAARLPLRGAAAARARRWPMPSWPPSPTRCPTVGRRPRRHRAGDRACWRPTTRGSRLAVDHLVGARAPRASRSSTGPRGQHRHARAAQGYRDAMASARPRRRRRRGARWGRPRPTGAAAAAVAVAAGRRPRPPPSSPSTTGCAIGLRDSLLRAGVRRAGGRLRRRLRRQPDGPARHDRPDLGEPGPEALAEATVAVVVGLLDGGIPAPHGRRRHPAAPGRPVLERSPPGRG